MHGTWWGACVAHGRGVHGRGMHAWQGACVVGGVHDGGHAWQGGACMVAGVHGRGGACVPQQILWDMVNERVVRILLECILVAVLDSRFSVVSAS